jgi:hypothetical protein
VPVPAKLKLYMMRSDVSGIIATSKLIFCFSPTFNLNLNSLTANSNYVTPAEAVLELEAPLSSVALARLAICSHAANRRYIVAAACRANLCRGYSTLQVLEAGKKRATQSLLRKPDKIQAETGHPSRGEALEMVLEMAKAGSAKEPIETAGLSLDSKVRE